MSNIARAQIVISAHPKEYSSGKNISCHGNSDGEIEIEVNGGNGPYWFTWKKAPSNQSISFNQNIYNLGAGEYTVKVTDQNSNTETATITLVEPNSLNIQLVPEIYGGGYNINEQGGANGSIECHVSGGTEVYSYLWNDPAASTTNIVNGLTAGTYSVQVTDMMGCSANESVTLTEPSQLHIINISSPLHNGYNVSCYNGEDGAINISVGGGVPPYHYQWAKPSYESTAQNPTGLRAGHYSIIVRDQNDGIVVSQIILTAPPDFRITSLTPVVYPPQNKNLSCNSCSNGSLTVNFTGGIGNKSYQWENTQTNQTLNQLTQTVTNLAAGTYKVTVTDANGCSASGEQGIVAPERDDWSMMGNAGITSNQFIGTTDNTELNFKTNNISRFKLMANGNINFPSMTGTAMRMMLIDGSGNVTPGEPFDPGPSYPLCSWHLTNPWHKANSVGPSGAFDVINCDQRFGFGIINPLERIHAIGFARFVDATNTPSNYLNVGFDGSSKINSIGTDLLINYNSSQNVNVNTGTSRGNFTTGGNSYLASLGGKVGIRNSSPHDDLEIGNLFTFHNDGTHSWIGYNYYYTGTDTRISNGYSSIVDFGNGGDIAIKTAGNGSGTISSWKNAMYIKNNGNIGFGTLDPNDNVEIGDLFTIHDDQNNSWIAYNNIFSTAANDFRRIQNGYASRIFLGQNGDLKFQVGNTGTTTDNIIWKGINITNEGKVGIGISDVSNWEGDYSLYVIKGIRTEKVKVDIATSIGWADYVFNKDYNLNSLENLEKYINKNSHLPGIPTSEEVSRDGIDVAEMQTKLLAKVEELTLYVIELNKKNMELTSSYEDLKKKLNKK